MQTLPIEYLWVYMHANQSPTQFKHIYTPLSDTPPDGNTNYDMICAIAFNRSSNFYELSELLSFRL